MQFYWNGKLEFNLSIYLSPSEQKTWSKYWSTTSPQSSNLHFSLPQRARLKLSCTAALPRNLEEHTPGSDFGKDFPVTWRSPKDPLNWNKNRHTTHRSRTTVFFADQPLPIWLLLCGSSEQPDPLAVEAAWKLDHGHRHPFQPIQFWPRSAPPLQPGLPCAMGLQYSTALHPVMALWVHMHCAHDLFASWSKGWTDSIARAFGPLFR